MSEGAMERGARVAWTTGAKGHVYGHTAVHRVFQHGRTYCSRAIDPAKVIAANPGFAKCGRCETLWNRSRKYLESRPDNAA